MKRGLQNRTKCIVCLGVPNNRILFAHESKLISLLQRETAQEERRLSGTTSLLEHFHVSDTNSSSATVFILPPIGHTISISKALTLGISFA